MNEDEKAHTPTDGEREALIKRLEEEVEYRVRTAVALTKGGHDHSEQVRQGRASIRFLAAGFRRSEAPEPSDEEIDPEVCKGCDEYDPLTLCEASSPETQGEPSDARVDAAIRAFHEATFGTPDDGFLTPERLARIRVPWRAALRAAGGVR